MCEQIEVLALVSWFTGDWNIKGAQPFLPPFLQLGRRRRSLRIHRHLLRSYNASWLTLPTASFRWNNPEWATSENQ